MNLKKYMAPVVEINETEAFEMIALSLKSGNADDSEVLTKEQQDWDMWGEDEQTED